MDITLRTAAPATVDLSDARPRAARSRWTRRIAAAATVAMGLAASGVALAAWNVTGEGSGAVAATSALSLEIDGFALDAALYPGLTTGATLTVSNPNAFPVSITTVEFGTIVVSNAGAGCTLAASEVTYTDLSNQTLFLAAATDNIELELANVATMGSGANTDCQGATFTAPITLTAESTTAP